MQTNVPTVQITRRQLAALHHAVPGSKASGWRQGYEFSRDQYGLILDRWRRYGDTFTLRFPGEPLRVCVGHPRDIKAVFAMPADAYYSGDPGLHANFGERCIVLNDGEQHRRDRQLLTPSLHGEMLREYGTLMLSTTERHLAGWQPGRELVAQEALATITLRIIARVIFGIEDEREEQRICDLMRQWLHALLAPRMLMISVVVGLNRMRRFLERTTDERLLGRPPRWPFPGRHSTALKAELMRILEGRIEDCRAHPDQARSDVLAQLATATYEDGERMSVRRVIDQLVLLFSAGHETTSNTLCWVLHDLLTRPALLARLRQEVDDAFGERPLDPMACQELPLLAATIKESMRLRPVTPMTGRYLVRPLALESVTLPPGITVCPINYIAHRHPESWEQPERFWPERFFDAKPSPAEYFPFGGGRRRCLGASFALFEMNILLAAIVRHVDLALAEGVDVTPVFNGITIGPKDGLRLTVVGQREPPPRSSPVRPAPG